mgnify:CR=1 FL=1
MGALGCAAIKEQAQAQLRTLGWRDYHAWWLACGTGTTLAGLVLAEAGAHRVYGALAVPEDHGVAPQVESIMRSAGLATADYELIDASRGGFAKVDPELLNFMRASEAASGVLHCEIRAGGEIALGLPEAAKIAVGAAS